MQKERSRKKKKRNGKQFESKYKPEYCKKLIAYMRQGGTFKGFCGFIPISRSVAYDWLDKHPEFKEAKAIAECAHMTWCDEQIREGIWGGKAFNAVPLIFALKNIHGWRDKIEINEDDEAEAVFV